MSSIEGVAGKVFTKLGLTVTRSSTLENRLPVEASESESQIIGRVRPFTMTSSSRIWSLLKSVQYIQENSIPGDFVECGVWRGGSVMAMAFQLSSLGVTDRRIWLYDTFEGMTPPSTADVETVGGMSAEDLLARTNVADGNNVWCVAGLGDVKANLTLTGYPSNQFTFVQGDVAQTLLDSVPESISLLRLDTDWYESTKAELEFLYPRLTTGGVCILDDYGQWAGARLAVDEFFQDLGARPLMNPIDYSGRIFVKPN